MTEQTTETFVNYPVQLNEHRAKSAADWSPREALISMLRRLDAKEIEPGSLVIIYTYKGEDEDEEDGVNFTMATASTMEAIGMLEMGKTHILEMSRA